jgi:5,5'-dehydrodivanillate O-demethylase
MYRHLLFEQIKKVKEGKDPLGIIRSPRKNKIIELPQEKEKFGEGASFLAESMELGHARYSPIKDLVQKLL